MVGASLESAHSGRALGPRTLPSLPRRSRWGPLWDCETHRIESLGDQPRWPEGPLSSGCFTAVLSSNSGFLVLGSGVPLQMALTVEVPVTFPIRNAYF